MPTPVWDTPEGPKDVRPWDGWFDHAAGIQGARLQWEALSDPLGVRDDAGRNAWMVGVWSRPEWPLFPPPGVDFQACDKTGRNLWFYYLDARWDNQSQGQRALSVLVERTPLQADAQGQGWWSVLLAGQSARSKASKLKINTVWLDVTPELVSVPGAQEAFWAAPDSSRHERALWMRQRAEETDLDHDNPSFGWEDGKLVPALLLWANTPHATPVEQAAVLMLGLRGLSHRYFDESGLLALAHSIPLEALAHFPSDFWTMLKMEHRLSQERRWAPVQACQDLLEARRCAHALGERWDPSVPSVPKPRF